MLDAPRIVRTEPRTAAIIRLTIPRERMRDVMGPAIAELMATLAAQGLMPTGPVFAHHLRMKPDTFDFEVGLPVPATVSASGRVEAGLLPGATVARTVYRGPYEGLHSAWGEFDAWIAADGHQPAPDLWECYATGPDTSPDPTTWKTELNRPLVG